jgi:glutathione S-transferase
VTAASGRLSAVLRVHRIPFSTNVERVALAAAHKGLDVEWVDHSPEDRSEVRALSGQDLVPVAEMDGEVVADSMIIVERLEALAPDPPLYPSDPAARAVMDVFVSWFNSVWKVPPNLLAEELDGPDPDSSRIVELGGVISARLQLFEDLLAGGPFLLGDRFSAADVCAFPFLKYALLHDPADTETFHRVLMEHQPLGDSHPRLRAWIERVDALPRA